MRQDPEQQPGPYGGLYSPSKRICMSFRLSFFMLFEVFIRVGIVFDSKIFDLGLQAFCEMEHFISFPSFEAATFLYSSSSNS